MKTYKLIGLSIFLIIITTLNVFAIPNEKIWYKGEDFTDSIGIFNLTAVGGASIVTNGKIGSAMKFIKASSQYANSTPSSNILNISNDFMCTYWQNSTSIPASGNNYMFGIGQNSASASFALGYSYVNPVQTRFQTPIGGNNSGYINWSNYVNKWNFFALYYNKTNHLVDFYVGNSTGNLTYFKEAHDSVASLTYAVNTQRIVLGAYIDASTHFDGTIDDFRCYQFTMSDLYNSTYVNLIWNNGTGSSNSLVNLASGSPLNPTINIISPTPTDGNITNTNQMINLSCSLGDRYNLYFGTTNPPTTLVINNLTISNWTTNATGTGIFYYIANCYNSTNGLFSTNTTVRNWTFDNIFPTFTLLTGNEPTVSTTWTTGDNDGNMILNFSLTEDNLLYAYEINITNSTGSTMYNFTNTTLTGLIVNISKNINTTTWPNGTYNVRLFVADAHTDEIIPEYIVKETLSKIDFTTEYENIVTIESTDPSFPNTQKTIDSYEFGFEFLNNQISQQTFNLKTTQCPLNYLLNSPYKGHFVSYCGSGGNWIDFEGTTQEPIINKVNEYYYQIMFSDITPIVQFESIGGLNVAEINLTWYKGSDLTSPAGTVFDVASPSKVDSIKYDIIKVNYWSIPEKFRINVPDSFGPILKLQVVFATEENQIIGLRWWFIYFLAIVLLYFLIWYKS